jgi:peroxiredoxin
LADFEENFSRFTEQGVQVVAASFETLDEARETAAGQNLGYPVGYGLDPQNFPSATSWPKTGSMWHLMPAPNASRRVIALSKNIQ